MKKHQPCQAEFTQQMIYVKERLKEREEEIEGGWYTEERMASELKYSASLVTKIKAIYARMFL